MLPTVLMAVCLSTVVNGLAFYLVGYLKLGTPHLVVIRTYLTLNCIGFVVTLALCF